MSPNLRSQRLNKLFLYVLGNDRVTFWVEGDRAHGAPVTRMTCPASRVALLRLGVKGMAGGQNGLVFTGVTLLRRHVTDAAVLVLQVVPVNECRTPLPGSLQRLEALGGELRAR